MPTTCEVCGKPLKKYRGVYYHHGAGRVDHKAQPIRHSDELREVIHGYLDELPDGSYVKVCRLAFSLGLPTDVGTRSIVGRIIAQYPRSNAWSRRTGVYVLEGCQ